MEQEWETTIGVAVILKLLRRYSANSKRMMADPKTMLYPQG
jgi:hypothetical protein